MLQPTNRSRHSFSRRLDSLLLLALVAATAWGILALPGPEAQAESFRPPQRQSAYPIPPTSTPPPTPTSAYPAPYPPPTTPSPGFLQLFTVEPFAASNATSTTVTLFGTGFQKTPTLKLGPYSLLTVRHISSEQLTAVVPAGLPHGIYDLLVANPDGTTALLAQEFMVIGNGPALFAVQPTQGVAGVENKIYLQGFNLAAGATVRLGTLHLPTAGIPPTFLRAVVSPTVATGTYDLHVTNPDGTTATAPDAYTLLTLDETYDDLYAPSSQLWNSPTAVRAGAPSDLGLVVTRQGGKNTLANVQVHFYVDNPTVAANWLGEATLPLLSPRSSESTTAIQWTPPTPGVYTLYAIIDPAESIEESLETNNRVSRTLTVLPSGRDGVAPRVDAFTADNGADSTADPNVRLDVRASDPTPSSGLQSVLYQEFEFSPGANQWVPARHSGWLDFATASTDYGWELLSSPGVKYLHAWVADQGGNISLFPFKERINYVPATARVGLNQANVYRYQLAPGDQAVVTLTPVEGDPDLYIWPPNPDAPPYVSNLAGSAVDSVRFSPSGPDFTGDAEGEFQIEIYGYTAATYQLSVQISPGVATASLAGGVDPDKSPLTQPLLNPDSVPASRQALPTAPVSSAAQANALYLPAVSRLTNSYLYLPTISQ